MGVSHTNIHYSPGIFVEPIEYYNAESFRSLIGCKSSDDNRDWRYHNRDNIIDHSYFTDYKENKVGVFTKISI